MIRSLRSMIELTFKLITVGTNMKWSTVSSVRQSDPDLTRLIYSLASLFQKKYNILGQGASITIGKTSKEAINTFFI